MKGAERKAETANLGDLFLKNGSWRFGVVKENIVVKSFDKNDERVVRVGTLVVIHSSLLLEDLVVFQVFDREGDKSDETLWVGEIAKMVPIVRELVAPFQAVSSPLQRVQISENVALCNQLACIEVGVIVNLTPDLFSGGELFEPEMSLVRYKGPVPELGVGHYFGLELLVSGAAGDSDGSICGKRYFTCQQNHGTFVALNRLVPYHRTKNKEVDHSLEVITHNREPNTSEVIPVSSAILMPSNDKRVQHHVENADSSSYKTTLVFHLKEKDNMPRSQPHRLERTEKLIDLESGCNTRDVDNTALRVGDQVVWFRDAEPEYATVKWIGHLDNSPDIMVGIDCDNPVGNGTGSHEDRAYFKVKKDHAKFIPLASLVKAEDFLQKPGDHVKKKAKNWKYIENCGSPATHQCSAISAEPPIMNLIDVPDNIPSPLHSKDKQDNGLCRSEYVFSESGLEPAGTKMDNGGKHLAKDSRNNNLKKFCNASNNYFEEVSPRHSVPVENVMPRHLSEQVPKNNNEMKLRHSTVNEVPSQSVLCESEWPAVSDSAPVRDRRPRAIAPGGRPTRLNNVASKEPMLEVVGEGLFPPQSKLTEANDTFLSTSPSASSDGSTGYEHLPDSPNAKEPTDLGVGSVVEVLVNGSPRYGVIRWIGVVPEDKRKGRKVAGIEMEEEHVGLSDGTFNGRRYFQCNPKKAMFVGLSQCQKDSRFQDMHPYQNDTKAKNFGHEMCPVIPGVVKPLCWKDDSEAHCGKFKGIQGHHNSCYLDATLFSMFTFTSAFDGLLFRPPTENDIEQYEEVQRVLREEIVNPLRRNLYVRADRVMKLRTLLENLSSVTGLTSEEKDPEEFLTSLVAQILRAEPFLKLSSGQEAYHYQLFVEKDEQLTMPSVQQLFDQSFLTSDIKLKEVPSCLIIQMPRFGKSFKMYPRILPTQLLDVTDIIEDSPRQCTVCGKLAKYECRECFGQCGSGLESIAFCTKCLETAHSHQRRGGHAWRKLQVPVEYSILQDHCHIPRLYMELFAVVCIETSHYVAFVKCGSGADAPWCFFDSMADRKGEQNGYNIPEMVLCPKLPYWLSDEGALSLREVRDDRLLPEHAKRLLCDAYMCMYQSPDVMMYR
ncbi:hypothetical protein R5R35_009357 [Gryllus longicercus]|uniref:ubiquitinyl hydrolase 1 n=1 Tax=Gryllus longicercus TaxID=2509291 RepID=A0AAN9YX14_9ORTH